MGGGYRLLRQDVLRASGLGAPRPHFTAARGRHQHPVCQLFQRSDHQSMAARDQRVQGNTFSNLQIYKFLNTKFYKTFKPTFVFKAREKEILVEAYINITN